MKIVLPSSSVDAARLPLLVDVMLKLGSLHGHEIMLVPTASVKGVSEVQAERLRAICPNVTVEAMETDPQHGWFIAPNIHFHFAFTRIHQRGYRGAIFWNEVDCVPVKVGWADALEKEWFAQGKPFCGCVVDTPFRTADGKITTEHGDRMMMGCGIYPNGMPTDELIKPLFADLPKLPPRNADQPWDVYLRWMFYRRGVAHTDLIGDMWNTQNYREEGGNIVCDAAPTRFVGRSRGGVVSPKNVVVHGCKDESLYRLILDYDAHIRDEHGVSIGVKGTMGPTCCGGLANEAAGLTPDGTPEEVVEFGERWKAALQTAAEEVTTAAEPPLAFPSNPNPESSPPILKLEKFLVASGKVRIKDAAIQTEIHPDVIRALLPQIGYATKGPGWIVKVRKGRVKV